MNTIKVLETAQGGYRLRVDQPDGSYALAGHYATAADAARVARNNGYVPQFELVSDIIQLELAFDGHRFFKAS